MKFSTGAFTEVELTVHEYESERFRYWKLNRREIARLSIHDQDYIQRIMSSRFAAEPVYRDAKIQTLYKSAK